MKNKILILGKGFIGERLREELGCAISSAKIYAFSDAEKEIVKFNPEIIINCIGYTGSNNVDDCENDKDRSLMANTFVPIILAEYALRNKIKLVQISSGCIYHFDYSKDKPITEDMRQDFFDLFYSRSKIYSERALEILCARYNILIARPRVPLDNRPYPKNLLTKLLNFKQVIDLPNSVTYLPDFIAALKHLLKIDARGIYNMVNKGGLRYPQLLDIYKKYVPGFKYKVADFRELGFTRTNLILSVEKLEKAGFKMRGIEEVLEECVRGYLNY